MAAKKEHRCKDCKARPEIPSDGVLDPAVEYRPKVPRPAPCRGPRCQTDWDRFDKATKARTHERRVQKVYGLSEGDYWKLYELQGGFCYICRIATGKTKRLAVDHNHDTNEVRGLLCGPCNKGVIGHLRHDIEALKRAIEYLENPPARALLASSP